VSWPPQAVFFPFLSFLRVTETWPLVCTINCVISYWHF
jgi:hypothetical protein